MAMIQSRKRGLMQRCKKILFCVMLLLLCKEVSSSLVNDNSGYFKSSESLTAPTKYGCQEKLLEIFVDSSIYLTQEAGSFVKNLHTNNKVSVKKKGVLRNRRFENAIMDDPITNADKLSNYILLYGFRILLPNFHIVSEEKLDIPRPESIDSEQLSSLKFEISRVMEKKASELSQLLGKCHGRSTFRLRDYTMWLDPLDATKEYAEQRQDLTKYISIMTCMAYRGKPVGGLVFFPFSAKVYWSYKIQDRNESRWKSTIVDAPPAENTERQNKVDLIYSRSHDGGVVSDLNGLSDIDVRSSTKAAGSGFKMVQVALQGGKSNPLIYAHNTKIKKWDICAGDALLSSTNGMTVDWSGKPIDYSYDSPKIISNGIVASKFDMPGLREALFVKFVSRKTSGWSLHYNWALLLCCFTLVYLCKRNRHKINALQIPIVGTCKVSIQKYSLCMVYNDAIFFLFYGSKKTGNHHKRDMESTREDNGAMMNRADPVVLSKKVAHEEAKLVANSGYYNSLLFSAVGLQGCYLLWGVCQENIMSQQFRHTTLSTEQHYFKHSQFVVFANRIFAFGIALCVHMYQAHTKHSKDHNPSSDRSDAWPPFYLFSFSSISNSLSSFCQYEALKYLSFPFHVVFKSSKLIPVMLMGYIINRKVYKRIEYIASMCISFGIYIFLQGGGQRKHKRSNTASSSSHNVNTGVNLLENNTPSANIGIFLMILYVCFDAFTSNWQSKLFKKHKVSKMQLMIGINFWSALFIFISITTSGEMKEAITLFQNHERVAQYSLFMLCISGALGQFFIYHTIKTFGPLIFSIIMATRQIFSIVLSCIIFQHTLNFYSIFGSTIVFLSIGMRIYYK